MERRAPPRPQHVQRPVFRANFLGVLFWVGLLTLAFALVFALPDLVEGARQLPAGPARLAEPELDQAREITRRALGGGRLLLAFAAAAVTVGAGIWARVLPGFRGPR